VKERVLSLLFLCGLPGREEDPFPLQGTFKKCFARGVWVGFVVVMEGVDIPFSGTVKDSLYLPWGGSVPGVKATLDPPLFSSLTRGGEGGG
jgi:hypothetical protein